MSEQLWMLCEHESALPHGFWLTNNHWAECPGGHPVEGGVALKWCDVHDAQQTAIEPLPEGIVRACWKRHTFAKYLKTPCRMVERFLIPLPAPKPEREVFVDNEGADFDD